MAINPYDRYYDVASGTFRNTGEQAASAFRSPTNPQSYLFPQSGQLMGRVEEKLTGTSQTPTNVANVTQPLLDILSQFRSRADIQAPNLSPIQLGTQFRGSAYAPQFTGVSSLYQPSFQDFENLPALFQGGIDPFGQMGISEGIQNINLQRGTENRRLASTLGRQAGNEGLLSVLQGQNLFRSQLAQQPLIAEALRGTAERGLAQRNAAIQQRDLQNQFEQLKRGTSLQNLDISNQLELAKRGVSVQDLELSNTLQQLQNQALLQQGGFNQQTSLAQTQAQLASLQPLQNLLEILSGLQGQQRGLTTQEQQVART